MGKSVTVKALTVEMAIEQALAELGATIEEVQVEVIEQNGKSMYGLKSKLAVVNVTMLKVLVPEQGEPVDSLANGARIIGKRVEVVLSTDAFPMIEPGSNVKVLINGREAVGKMHVSHEDDIRIRVSDEIIPPHFSIRLIEQDIIAMLNIEPGRRIKRTIQNTGFQDVLFIEADELVEPYMSLTVEDIVKELAELGISERIDYSVIEEAVRSLAPFEAIIAKGQWPVEGFNGDLYLHARGKDFSLNEKGKVDFREMNPIESVHENELIATYLPPVQGVDGMDLFGRPVRTKPVGGLEIRLGDQVEMRGNEIYALSSGRAILEKHGSIMKIDVNSEFVHDGDVDLNSGNIRFKGDVRIGGNVENSMFVGATGRVTVGGTVRKAVVESGKSACFEGNVFSSTVSVGMQEVLEDELVALLHELLFYLEQVQATILQIIHIRGVDPEEMDAGELKELVRVILKEKYLDYQQSKKDFIQKVIDHSDQLSPEWLRVSDRMDCLFTDTSLTIVKNAHDFSHLLADARKLIEQYADSSQSDQPVIKLPYAINSILSCSGTIEVTKKGLSNCIVDAKNKVFVEGSCRGGEITGLEKVSIQETGSVNSVKTIIKTALDGVISIGLARSGTEIWVGESIYYFDTDKLGVHARLVHGELKID
ncbi:FapA family protein [Sporosarcina sp. Sa2YVA2]|uniref:FapA family protein n=1 Tax=Sporosarcina quadrami TaxID=2762234 RepID=A0ABR8U765_9BACL|nr:flagellar assembly protein A [Sporosarcina quadrami]MBD7983873.1 FapA family protein [Sporosarcina quadrami]